MSRLLDSILTAEVAEHYGLSEALVEKDFAVTRLLQVVSQIEVPGFRLVFGGGTALARAHRLIRRMSEDVDLKLVSDGTEVSKSQVRKRRSQLKRDIVDTLSAAGFVANLEAVTADHENSHMLFQVPYAARSAAAILRPEIQLEVMASDLRRPAVDLPVASFVSEAQQHAPEVASIPCVSTTETAAEKMISLTRRIALEQESGGTRQFDRTIIRHVYDLHVIAPTVDAADTMALYRELVANDVAQYGNQHPVFNADPQAATFRALADLEANWTHRHAYANFQAEMVYGDQVPFHTAMETVLQLVATAWGTQPRRIAPSPALFADMVAGTAGRLVADFAESQGFRATLEQSADLAIDLTPEAEAAIPQVAKHLPPVGTLTVSQHGGRGQLSTPQAAADVLVSAAVGVAAERLANATWNPAKGLDHLQSDRLAAERTTAFAGYTVYRVLRDGEVVLITDDLEALVAMTPEQLLGLNGDAMPEDLTPTF